jgi:predicted MFS family arabinose efflux permease
VDFIINAKREARPQSLWRHADFLKLWIGQTVSEIGSRISREGIPLTAVLVLHASTAEMGILTATSAVSVLLFSLVAGVWVDRVRRRPLMIATDLGRALLLASIPLAAAFGRLNMPQLYAVIALAGVLTVFFNVAYQSILPSLLGGGQLFDGNSKLATSAATAEVMGPGLTGVLVQLITAPIAILFDALSFLFSAFTIWLIRQPEPTPVRHAHENLRTEITAGLRFIWGEPVLRALGLMTATAFLFQGLIGPLYILYGIRELKMGPAVLGIAIAAGGAGNLIGSTLAPAFVRRMGLGRMMVTTSVFYGSILFLVPLAQPPLVFALSCLLIQQFFGDLAMAAFNVSAISLRQTLAPENVLGRVNAAMQMLSMGVLSVGALFGGLMATAIGSRFTLAVAAGGVLGSSLWIVASPVRKLKDLPGAGAASGEIIENTRF